MSADGPCPRHPPAAWWSQQKEVDLTIALRVVTAAVLIAVIGTGLLMTGGEGPADGPAGLSDSSVEAARGTGLFDVTLDAEAIPEDLAGILFFRKIYPTDQDISYVGGFIPPNTFVRYVESGELGIRPRSETQIIRAGSSWAEAELVAAGEEASSEPGTHSS